MAASVEQDRSRRLVPEPQDPEQSVQPPQDDQKEQAPFSNKEYCMTYKH